MPSILTEVTATPEFTEAPTVTEVPTIGPTATVTPTPTPTPSPTPTLAPVIASATVVAQFPPAGTEVYTGESVEIYFYNVRMLQTVKEVTLEYPSDLAVMGNAVNVRIESRQIVGGSSFADVLYNAQVERKDFPLKYYVNLPVNNIPARVTIYINGAVYSQVLVTEDFAEKQE